jgi:hypothetical protein
MKTNEKKETTELSRPMEIEGVLSVKVLISSAMR